MYEDIIQKMADIVEATMKNYKNDFYYSDKRVIEKAEPSDFPMVWSISSLHTNLSVLGKYAEVLATNEMEQYAVMRGDKPFEVSYTHSLYNNDRFFLVMPDSIREITRENFKEIVRDIINPVVRQFKATHNQADYPKRVDFSMNGITFTKLKELIRECREHNDDSLLECLKRLRDRYRFRHNQAIYVEYYESVSQITGHRSRGFGFQEYINDRPGLNGCIKFHGWPETGYYSDGSVQISPSYGWSQHT